MSHREVSPNLDIIDYLYTQLSPEIDNSISCQSAQDIDNMDSLTLYFDPSASGKSNGRKLSVSNTPTLDNSSRCYLSDLDPSSELSLDLEALLKSGGTPQTPGPDNLLFPDLSFPKNNDLDTPEIQTQPMPHPLSAAVKSSIKTSPKVTTTVTTPVAPPQVSPPVALETKPSEGTKPSVDAGNQSTEESIPSDLVSTGVVSLTIPGQKTIEGVSLASLQLPRDWSLLKVKEEPVSSTIYEEDLNTNSEEDKQKTSSSNYKAHAPSRTTKSSSRRRQLDKGSQEYKERRARNNVAVRKSRDKAKANQIKTENKVKELSEHNQQLTKKVESLTQELNVLKELFGKVGVKVPAEYQAYISKMET